MDSLSPDDLHCVLDAVFEGTQESYHEFRRIVREQIHIMTVCKAWNQTVFRCIETRMEKRFQCMLEFVFAIHFYRLVRSKPFDNYEIKELSKQMTINKNVSFLHTAHVNGLDVILPDEEASMRDVCILTYNMRRIHKLTSVCLVYCASWDRVKEWIHLAEMYGLNVWNKAAPWNSIKDDCDMVIVTYNFMIKKRIPDFFVTVLHQHEKFPRLVSNIINKNTVKAWSTVYVTNVLNSFWNIGFYDQNKKHYVSEKCIKEGMDMKELMGPRWSHVDTDVCASVIKCLCVT